MPISTLSTDALRRTLPLMRTPIVFHVGRTPRPLTAARKDESLEGPGLSVSHCPEAWTAIAKLGGYPTHALRHTDGSEGAFVDVRALWKRQRAHWITHFEARGWLSRAPVFVVESFDDDLDETVEFITRDFGTALAELDDPDASPCDDPTARVFGGRDKVIARDRAETGRRVLGRVIPVATPELDAWWRTHFVPKLDDLIALDMALSRFVAEETTHDGLWWTERLDPANYSAPRGVIVPRALDAWAAALATDDDLFESIDEG
jgi:hypothetical protein